MKLLETQEQFEQLWFYKEDAIPDGMNADKGWIVYFTAAWCAPCKKLDLEKIDAAAELVVVPIWKCDAEVNDYTAGYCSVRKFPTFLYCKPKTIVSTLQSTQTESVIQWINSLNTL